MKSKKQTRTEEYIVVYTKLHDGPRNPPDRRSAKIPKEIPILNRAYRDIYAPANLRGINGQGGSTIGKLLMFCCGGGRGRQRLPTIGSKQVVINPLSKCYTLGEEDASLEREYRCRSNTILDKANPVLDKNKKHLLLSLEEQSILNEYFETVREAESLKRESTERAEKMLLALQERDYLRFCRINIELGEDFPPNITVPPRPEGKKGCLKKESKYVGSIDEQDRALILSQLEEARGIRLIKSNAHDTARGGI